MNNWPQNISASLRWLILAAALMFTASQVVASHHIHIDGEVEQSCVSCLHSHHSPSLTPQAAFEVVFAPLKQQNHRQGQAVLLRGLPSFYSARAPPAF